MVVSTMNNTSPVISIIVPVYNSSSFLPECLESILCQSFKDWEAILVDDKSTDCSLEICRDYAKRDSRIKVLSMTENSGPVLARSCGLKQAQGKYISFVDSDDLIAEDMYEHMVMLMEQYSADFVMVQRQPFVKSDEVQATNTEANIILKSQKDFAKEFFKIGSNDTVFFMTDKLYRRELAELIDIPENIIHGEDVIAICQVLLASQNIVCSDRKLYMYRINPNGITGAKFSDRDFQLIQVWDFVKDLVKNSDKEYVEYADLNRKRIAMTLLFRMHKSGSSAKYKKEEQLLRDELIQNGRYLMSAPIPKMRKMVIWCYLKAYPIMKFVFSLYGKVKR